MLDRRIAPPFKKSISFHLPEANVKTLNNGMRFLHLKAIQQEVIKLEVVFSAGKWFEKKPETAHFTVQMLDKGTTTKTSTEIAEYFDRYGAHLELSSDFDHASVSLYSLKSHFKKVYPLFLEIITDPCFAPDELSLIKENFIQSLRVKNEKTSYQASRLIRQNIFGKAHPYGHAVNELEAEDITSKDLQDYFNEQFQPSHAFLLGNLPDDNLESLYNDFEAFKKRSVNLLHFDIYPSITNTSIIEKEKSIQSSIRLGKRTIQRTHEDYPGLILLNYYLGGFFGSKLMKNLREDKGLTYGISSSISPFVNDCILLIGTDVNKENRTLAISEILKEISQLQTLIKEDELELAKRHFIGSMQGDIASPFSVLSKIKVIELFKLPMNYYSELIKKIDGFSADELIPLAKKYYQESTFHRVAVG